MSASTRLTFAAVLLGLAWWVVYPGYIALNYRTIDGALFRDLSLADYQQSLQGIRAFPYQWRMLGNWLVRAGELTTGLDPHVVDAAMKTAALAASSFFLFLFSTTLVDSAGALIVTALYFLFTASAFASQGPSIYFLNDYLFMAGWCGAVAAARRRRWALVALAAFAAAWARETAVLIVLLMALEAWCGRAPGRAFLACAAAAAVPTIILRARYPAPVEAWAWWHVAAMNVPLLDRTAAGLALVVRNNLKVFLFLNVFWVLAILHWRRRADPFLQSLALTLGCYVVMVWSVAYLRELRHMLPFTVLVLPLAVAEAQRRWPQTAGLG